MTENKKDLSRECKLMGHKVDLNNIDNPHLRKAIAKRSDFIFSHSESANGGYTDGVHETRYIDHTEYGERADRTIYIDYQDNTV